MGLLPRRQAVLALRLALLLEVTTTLVRAWPAGGAAECPCVQPWADAAPAVREARFPSATGSVPGDYGASVCRAWDENVTALCGMPTPPEFCSSSWCYVNASDCYRPSDASHLAFEPAGFASSAPFTYSYETCGNLNAYSRARHYEVLQGKTLRVTGMPADQYYNYGQPGQPGWDGSHVALFRDIAREAGLSWNFVNNSDASTAWAAANKKGSAYWACVHEIALNNTDICVGAFFVIPARRAMAPFTVAIESRPYRLLVPKVAGESFRVILLKPL
jgi:hypothetical protein